MVALHLKGLITEDGQLKVDLPEGITPGEVDITVELAPENVPWELRPWTKEELAELMKPDIKTGAEIVAMLQEMGSEGWDHITDGAEWVREQRRKSAENSKW